ncbi:protein HEG isoform X2 [Osmerus eperlanus]|uniref:protein HEG isoform X2 n=1 Tax=Osmerus eperlanus TaxID=29151 RepID=UPI002E0D27B6
METCFLNIVLRLFMVVVAGPQNAWTYTKSSDMDGTVVTEGHFSINFSNSKEVTALPKIVFSTGTDFRELITTRGLQRTDEPQTQRKLGTDQNMHISLKTDSWTPEESMILSTEPLSSTVMGTTEATTQWEDQTPDTLTDTYTALPGRSRAVTQEQMPQDNPDTALMLGDSTEMRTVGLSAHTDNDEVKTRMRTVGLSAHTDNDEVKTRMRTVGLSAHTDNDEVKTRMRTVGLNVNTDNEEVKTRMRTVGLNVHTDNDEVKTRMRTVGLSVQTDNDEVRTVGLNVHTDNDEVRTEMRTVGLNVHTDNDELRTDERTVGLYVRTASDEVRTVGLPVHTESTYISSTITRAGERTLLSVTSNSTSTYTEDSNPSQSSSWGLIAGVTGSRDHADTKADGLDSTSQSHDPANSSSETEGPGLSPATVPLTGPPSTTEQNTTSSEEDSPNSTPPLDVLDNNTRWQKDSTDPGHSSGGGTTPAEDEVSSSSSPPAPSTEDGPTNTTQLGGSSSSSIGTSTHSSTGYLGTQSQGRTEGMTSQAAGVEETTRLGLTTTPPRGRDVVTSVDDSLSRFLSGQPPFTSDTPRLGLATEAQATTPSASTHRTQVTEVDEETHRATAAAETTPTPPLVTTWTVEPPSSSTHLEAHTQRTTPSTTTDSSLGQQASASTSQHQGGSGTQTQTQTQRPSTGESPTDTTLRHLETTTATPDNHTTHSHHTTAFSIRTTPTRSTLALTTSTSRDTERGTTEVGVTTARMDVRSTPTAGRACSPNPCVNGGMCVTHGQTDFTCHCLQAWSGPTCGDDVDECQNDPCPLVSRCVNTRGSFSCECPLGLDLEDGRTCTRAKTFLGTFRVNNPRFDPLLSRSTTLHEIQREILQLLNASLSTLPGYSRSTLRKREEDGLRISAVNMFSASTEVTSSQVYHSIQTTLSNCSSASSHCQLVLHHQLSYHEESLCLAQKVPCDTERSDCSDSSGTAYCRCRPGYFKLNPGDMSCIECGDGSKLENGTCVRCTFGFGGFNCGNFYKLIAVVVSPAGGALLLILIIALIVTCCKKDKNDINKIIFKSGDFQMSPYAEFPKSNPRVSMEWGREAIEMQENGSTKNLLQMTDIYYSPALRNSDLERNGLYPFSGLPGSRHSCIYPAQWNPSFISDDSRRRDYF